MGWFLVLVGGIVIVTFLLIWCWLAPTNRWFTFVKEGTTKIVVRGDKFERALIQWEGRTFQYQQIGEDKWTVIEEKEPWHPFGGLRFYGVWPIWDIYIYKFKWSGVTENGEVIHHPSEILDYVLLKDDVYWCKIEKCEDKNLLPLDLELLLTVAMVNPYKALFKIQNWLETVINRMKPFTRGYITQKEFEMLITEREVLGEGLMKKFKEVGLLDEFENWYGVRVKKVEVKEINPPEGYREKTIAPYLAELEKKATVIKAKAEGMRIKTIFQQIQKFGDLGKLVRTLEAVERSPLAASLTVQAIPGLQEVLRGVFGKGPEAITREEFRELREMIEKLKK